MGRVWHIRQPVMLLLTEGDVMFDPEPGLSFRVLVVDGQLNHEAAARCCEFAYWTAIDRARSQQDNKREKVVSAWKRALRTVAAWFDPVPEDVRAAREQERAHQNALLDDLFGNPFRPVTFAPEWRTDTVRELAEQMYASRDFSPMPILADALQDAGCDSEALLSHCREAKQAHVRGCWVVDLVLGKE